MSKPLNELVDLLSLEQIEENLFRGQSLDLGFRQLFGGQALGQSVSAASQTVDPSRSVHSVHGYFMRPGDASLPVVYQVERQRDGGSFSSRRVTAIQKGSPIFACSASFHIKQDGFEHQLTMPQGIAGPEGLPSEQELAARFVHLIPEHMREPYQAERAIEIRPVNLVDPLDPQPTEPVKYLWFKANGQLPDNPNLHKYLLSYASDFNLLATSVLPHGVTFHNPNLQMASIDHALWIHGDVKMDDWLLYAMDSPWAGNARGFSRASIFNRQGQLVASVAQEGLIRLRADKKA
jgi:acyl-CoA thioesterase-2